MDELFPVLAASLPAPFPIFGRDEEHVVTWGYPLLLSEGVLKLRRDLELSLKRKWNIAFAQPAIATTNSG